MARMSRFLHADNVPTTTDEVLDWYLDSLETVQLNAHLYSEFLTLKDTEELKATRDDLMVACMVTEMPVPSWLD